MTPILVDTQALLWWLSDDPRLGRRARDLLARENLAVSVASLWEIAIKAGIGKLSADVGEIARAAAAQGMARLALSDAHLEALQRLPRQPGHGDPFDRLLVSQAAVEGWAILTADTKFEAYDVVRLDAMA